MMDHPRCETCKHWDLSRAHHTLARFMQNPPRYEHHQGPPSRGVCVLATDDPDGTATARVDAYEEAELITERTHYCAMHSALHEAKD